jgi:hypothetical protein
VFVAVAVDRQSSLGQEGSAMLARGTGVLATALVVSVLVVVTPGAVFVTVAGGVVSVLVTVIGDGAALVPVLAVAVLGATLVLVEPVADVEPVEVSVAGGWLDCPAGRLDLFRRLKRSAWSGSRATACPCDDILF